MAFRNSKGKGGFLELEIRRHGGILTSGILKAWGGLDLGFTQETDRNVFLESAFFMDVLNQFVNRALTSDIADDRAAEAEYKSSIDQQACVRFH